MISFSLNKSAMLRLCSLCLLASSLTSCTTLAPPKLPDTFAGDYTPVTTYLSAFIEREMRKGDLTGLSIALVDGQKMVWSEGFGYADKKGKIKATATTRYRAGSVSKLLNAVAMMQLVEKDMMDLDQPITDYVPEFAMKSRFGRIDDITLRSLLSHQSGMPSDIYSGMWESDPIALEGLLDAWNHTYVVSPANRQFNYSNTGISLSGLALQRIVEQPYEQYMQDTLLAALDMENSDFSGQLEGNTASKAYDGKALISETPLRDTPAGGLNTTVEDLGNFLIAIHGDGIYNGKKIIEKSTLDEMYRVQNEGRTIDMGLRVGLAWFHAPELLGGRYEIVGHDGRTIAHSAKLVTAPDAGLGVIVLSNSADNKNATSKIAREALKQLYATRQTQSITPPTIEPITNALVKIADLSGDYAGPFNLIQIEADEKYYKGTGLGMKVSLRPEPDNWYSVKIKLGGLTIQPDELKSLRVARMNIDGKDRLVGLDDGTPFLLGDYVEPYSATASWDSMVGHYENTNPLAVEAFNLKHVEFLRGNDYYYVQVTDNDNAVTKSPIKPLNDEQFIFLGTGRGLGETVTVKRENGKATFIHSGMEFVQQ